MAGWVRIAPRDILPVALLGIGQFSILIVLLNYGLQFMPSARGALIFATFPLMTMLLTAVLGKETLNRLKIAGATATIVGVGLILGEKALEAGSESCAACCTDPTCNAIRHSRSVLSRCLLRSCYWPASRGPKGSSPPCPASRRAADSPSSSSGLRAQTRPMIESAPSPH